jgi:2-polyprenyl-3-methyl-5-hydroxy-6-metoxy-1,4-benzoquinol methylase
MADKFKIISDPEHGFLRADPVPTQQEVEEFYKQEFYSSDYKNFNDSSLKVQEEEEDYFTDRWESIYRKCVEHFGHSSLSLFDIGFGFAQALLYFRERGFDVSGLEPAPEAVEYARSKGLDVHNAGIEDFDCVGDKRFDVVTLINVLEHLRDPAATLQNIKAKLLKPDGLLIIDVPNEFNDFQAIADKEYGLNQWWVCPPNHINYFSATSVKKLLADCGYSVFHSEASFPLEMFLLMADVYVGNGELGKACHNKRVKFEYLMRKHGKKEKLVKFYQALAELDLGRQVIVYATTRSA